MQKVTISNSSACWNFESRRKLYPQFFSEGVRWGASHWSLTFLAQTPRPFPQAMALHSCGNPRCVNPEHLRWGTQRDNIRDALARDRIKRRLSVDEIDMLRRRVSAGASTAQLARKLSLPQTVVWNAVYATDRGTEPHPPRRGRGRWQ